MHQLLDLCALVCACAVEIEIDYLRRSHEGILAGIRETTKFDDAAEAELVAAYDSFLDQFETSDGQSIKAGKEEHVALEDEDVEQEQIVKQKRG